MKFINKYMAMAAVGAVSLASCNDLLDVESPSQMGQEMAYNTVENATNSLNGVYVLFCADEFTSRMSAVWMQNTDVEASAPSAGVPVSDRRAIWSLQAKAAEGFKDVYNAWNNRLSAIERANQVIQGVDESTIGSQAAMQQIKGEAVCLKAYSYYLMCGFWGDVPYYDKPGKWGEEIDLPRTDKNIIYSRVLQELVNIEPSMQFSDVNTGGIERMNRDFAIGLIARIALFRAGYGKTADGQMKRADDYLDVTAPELTVTYTDNTGNKVTAQTSRDYYQMAKDYCQKLISLKPRKLNADFYTAFYNENTYTVVNNSEVLYEVAFLENFGGDVGWCIGVTNTNKCAKGTTTNQVGLTPSYYMSFADNDLRRDITCANWGHSSDTITVSTSTGMGVGKWDRALATKDLGSGSSKGTGINWPLMRWSDILLMLAEAENELNGPTDLAKNALMEVRDRAFKGSETYADDVTDYVNSLTRPDDFFNAIVNERAWEFGGEGLRRFDLIRWNLYAKKLEESVRTMLCWGISTVDELLALDEVRQNYPEAVNYTAWADKLYYKITDKKNRKTDITWYNKKYRADNDDETMTADKWRSVNWGSAMIKNVRTYIYDGKSYDACAKSTNEETGEVKYTLGTAPNTIEFTVPKDEPSGVTRISKYVASDYATRIYRGYLNDGALTGNGNVPFLLPIGTTTLSASTVLNNDGWGLSEVNLGEGINVVVGEIQKENY